MKAYGLSTLFLQEKPVIKVLGFKILSGGNGFLSRAENGSGAHFTCISLPFKQFPPGWWPSNGHSLGSSPHLDHILLLPLLRSVTGSQCLNLSEPWLLNFCTTVLNNTYWTGLQGRWFSEPPLWKRSPEWPTRTRCLLHLRSSYNETNCFLISRRPAPALFSEHSGSSAEPSTGQLPKHLKAATFSPESSPCFSTLEFWLLPIW